MNINLYRNTAAIQIAVIAVIGLISGCASVDFDYPKQESFHYQKTAHTDLAELTLRYEQTHPGESGFQLQVDGIDSLAARLALADAAELSIDTQYYLIKDDLIGFAFADALLEAADRGVRVRLLLDDIFTQGMDASLMTLSSHPNVEVRLFNPWASRQHRVADIFGFSRLNRRMHTKSFTVDNEVTIIGGRNIADEYYGARKDVNFGDLDVMGIGPVVSEVSTVFDEFWNSKFSLPVEAVAKAPENPAQQLEQLRNVIAERMEATKDSIYASAVIADFERYMQADEHIFSWAPYLLAYDSPDKAEKKQAKDAVSIVDPLAEAVLQAKDRLVIISPYFVPRRKGIEFFQQLRDRGLEVIIITNSLAANNHTLVHAGYAPSRKPLLKMGVKIYELRTTAVMEDIKRGGAENARSTLHTKSFIVDSDKLFVGSFNWDPRSVSLNTELGVIIESENLAGEVIDRLERRDSGDAYEVVLDDIGQLRWIDRSGEEAVVLKKEPDTTWGKRFSAGLMELLPIRGQL